MQTRCTVAKFTVINFNCSAIGSLKVGLPTLQFDLTDEPSKNSLRSVGTLKQQENHSAANHSRIDSDNCSVSFDRLLSNPKARHNKSRPRQRAATNFGGPASGSSARCRPDQDSDAIHLSTWRRGQRTRGLRRRRPPQWSVAGDPGASETKQDHRPGQYSERKRRTRQTGNRFSYDAGAAAVLHKTGGRCGWSGRRGGSSSGKSV